MLVIACLPPASWSASLYSSKYDVKIKRAAELYLPTTDWRLYKAQLFQESRLESAAVSPVGAMGVAQFMPATWAEVSDHLGLRGSAHSPDLAITAGAYYLGSLRKRWSAPRPYADRHSLAMASYNAGMGNLLKAQRKCGGRNLYSEIAPCLPAVTGHHSKETLGYVRRIWNYYIQLVIGEM